MVLAFLMLGLWPLAHAGQTNAFAQDGRLRPGESIRLVCVEDPSLCVSATLDPGGWTKLPLVGWIGLGGLTLHEAEARLRAHLNRSGNLVWTISVQRTSGRRTPVSVSGAVRFSLTYPWREGLRLSEVLAVALPTESADLSAVRIIDSEGRVNTFSADSDGGRGPALRAGDQIHITPTRTPNAVYILGAVTKPGSVAYRGGLTVAQALAECGGASGNGDLTRIEIERGDRVVAALNREQAADFLLQPGDAVRVPLVAKPAYVFVVGAVTEEGRYDFRPGMTLTGAIAAAKGLLPSADPVKVTIARRVQGALRRTTYDLEKIFRGLVPDVDLQPSDIVEVGAR